MKNQRGQALIESVLWILIAWGVMGCLAYAYKKERMLTQLALARYASADWRR